MVTKVLSMPLISEIVRVGNISIEEARDFWMESYDDIYLNYYDDLIKDYYCDEVSEGTLHINCDHYSEKMVDDLICSFNKDLADKLDWSIIENKLNSMC